MSRKEIRFTVDAALLRELGERLVGRPHVALAELIKNAYDADATTCVVHFGSNRIEILDNGHGMTEQEFRDHWMRIGTTHKVEERVSHSLGRPLVGSKGIGRLSAQFLAHKIRIETKAKRREAASLKVDIDWRGAMEAKDLTSFVVKYEIGQEQFSFPKRKRFGTRVILEGLKNDWEPSDFLELAQEVWMLRSPLTRIAPAQARGDFEIALETPDEAARAAFEVVPEYVLGNWLARIEGRVSNGRRLPKAEISVEFKPGFGDHKAETFSEIIELPVRRLEAEVSSTAPESALENVRFQIYVFKHAGRQPGGVMVDDVRKYFDRYGGVHVYDGGFRLPHYGGSEEEDWLQLERDHARRVSASELLPEQFKVERMMLDLPTPRRLLGIVEISTGREELAGRAARAFAGEILTINVSRDRLVDNAAFQQLRNLVRWSIDFYASRYRLRGFRRVERERTKEPPQRKLDRLTTTLEEYRREIPASAYQSIKRDVEDYTRAAGTEESYRESVAALLAPLATAGMSALALTHELNREFGQLRDIIDRLRQLSAELRNSELGELATALKDWRTRMEALQALFSPLATAEDRDASHRLRVKGVIHQVTRAMKPLLPGVKIEEGDGLTDDLRFPVGSMAEWSAVLQNLMSNAWNAMLDSDRAIIRFDGGRRGRGKHYVWISDTGCGLGVRFEDSDHLFEPFERALEVSPDRRSLIIGGRGLGLPIVRMIAQRRGCSVRFVEPVQGYATTLEIAW